MSRICARPSCSDTASATLTYAYADSTVWLSELSDEAHPMTHDICAHHAHELSVPRGWQLCDERVDAPDAFSPELPLEQQMRASFGSSQHESGRNRSAHSAQTSVQGNLLSA